MFLSGLLGGALGYISAAPFFYASRVAHADAGLLTREGVFAAGGRVGHRFVLPSVREMSFGLPRVRPTFFFGLQRYTPRHCGAAGRWWVAEAWDLRCCDTLQLPTVWLRYGRVRLFSLLEVLS